MDRVGSDDTTLTVKFRRDDVQRLKNIAREIDVPPSTLVRVIALGFLKEVETARAQEHA